jgi:hypothetical protein
MFLEKREQMLGSFTAEFQQLTLADEKTDLLNNFLHTLALEMDKDPMWQGMKSTPDITFRDLLECHRMFILYKCCRNLIPSENIVYVEATASVV